MEYEVRYYTEHALFLIRRDPEGALRPMELLRIVEHFLRETTHPQRLRVLVDLRDIAVPPDTAPSVQRQVARAASKIVEDSHIEIVGAPELFTTMGAFLATAAQNGGKIHATTDVAQAWGGLGLERAPDGPFVVLSAHDVMERRVDAMRDEAEQRVRTYRERQVRLALDSAHQHLSLRIRDLAAQMQSSRDLRRIVGAVRTDLQEMGVPLCLFCVSLVELADMPVVHMHWSSTNRTYAATRLLDSSVLHVWRRGELLYRPDLDQKDALEERDVIRAATGEEVRSYVDIPFPYGTVAMASTVAYAFKSQHLDSLVVVGEALALALQRHLDLRAVEMARDISQEQKRVLEGIQRIGTEAMAAQNEGELVDRIARCLISLFQFRSLTVARVDHAAEKVINTHNYICIDGTCAAQDQCVTPGRNISRVDERLFFALDEDGRAISGRVVRRTPVVGRVRDIGDPADKMALAAASSRVQLWEGYGHKLTPEPTDALDRSYKIAYFVPILHQGKALLVLATGSTADRREHMLRLLDALQPLFDQLGFLIDYLRIKRGVHYEEHEEFQAADLLHSN